MKYLQCRRKLDSVFRVELEKRKEKRKECIETMDLMDSLMDIKDNEGNHLTDDEVVDNIVSFIVAGYVSTSLASVWALYYLSKSPKVLQKLRVISYPNTKFLPSIELYLTEEYDH